MPFLASLFTYRLVSAVLSSAMSLRSLARWLNSGLLVSERAAGGLMEDMIARAS